jgi:pimeloyl-ACP methyl ester carboxylesterase
MTVLKWLLVVVSVAYACGLALLFFVQRSFLFPVPTVVRTSPRDAGFPEAEEHVLTTADGEKVIVWHVPAKPGHPVIFYFHGNGDFLAGLFGRFRELIADGAGVVALSYRGYAGSSGQPSESGLLTDADAAYAFTAARYSADRMVVWGFSLGSGVAVALAAKQPVGKVILEAPYTSITDVAAFAVSNRAGTLADQGFVSIRHAHRACHGTASDYARRTRSGHSDQIWRAFVHARS